MNPDLVQAPGGAGMLSRRVQGDALDCKGAVACSGECQKVNVPVSSRAGPLAQPSLRECVALAVRRYLCDLGEQMPEDFYHLVLHEVELPMLAEVLRHYRGNQSRAAAALGMNRATLRKKLRQYGLA